MYAGLWRLLPGPTWLKAIEAVALVLAVVWVLFSVVFPWIEPRLPFDKTSIGS